MAKKRKKRKTEATRRTRAKPKPKKTTKKPTTGHAQQSPSKKKRTPKKANKSPAIDEAMLQNVSLLLVRLRSTEATHAAIISEFKQTVTQADAYMAAARVRLIATAGYDLTEQLGKSITRLNDLYQTCVELFDTKTALATQKELNRLLDLKKPAETSASEADAAGDLATIREHLTGLDLSGDPEAPTVELVRLAALRLLTL